MTLFKRLLIFSVTLLFLISATVMTPTTTEAEEFQILSIAYADDGNHKNSLEVMVENNLYFSRVIQNETPISVTVLPSDPGAAVFSAKGSPYQKIIVKIKRKNMYHEVGDKNKIEIENFLYGGSLIDTGKSGIGQLDRNGRINNMRVGGTAVIPYNPEPGSYSGYLELQANSKK